MNPSIKKLAEITRKDSKKIIGLMSGTSLDGLDVALCEVSGSGSDTEVKLIQFDTHPYDESLKNSLKKISSKETVSLEEVCLMHTRLAGIHGEMILKSLKAWGTKADDIDAIASHGQTIYHAPKIQHMQDDIPNTTLQIGDGDHLARTTGILTLSDFRQKHTAAGGEGAPMVSLVDRILFGDQQEDRILLNIGGIANFTWLPATRHSQRSIITTDTGPGNTLIDAAVQEHFSMDFDEDSRIARKGTVDTEVLQALKAHDYFAKAMPKTTGPEVFNLDWVQQVLETHSLAAPEPADLIATLTCFSAETIAEAISQVKIPQSADGSAPVIYISGGGIHNPLMVEWIRALLPDYSIKNFSEIGFDPDAKEAVLFAVLANEMLSGSGFPMDPNSAESQKVNFGKISFPV